MKQIVGGAVRAPFLTLPFLQGNTVRNIRYVGKKWRFLMQAWLFAVRRRIKKNFTYFIGWYKCGHYGSLSVRVVQRILLEPSAEDGV